MARHLYVGRPEGGGEHDMVISLRHNCRNAREERARRDDPNADEVLFPVGLQGYEMPLGVPWECAAAHECGVCNTWLKIWVTWVGPHHYVG